MSNRLAVIGALSDRWDNISGYGRDKLKARKILALEDPETVLNGPKTTSFYRLLRDGGNDIDVCVDGHIANLARNERRLLKSMRLTGAQYERIAQAVRRAAKKLDERPCDVQAALWIAWRSSAGFVQRRIEFAA
jgi:hypothetical protein